MIRDVLRALEHECDAIILSGEDYRPMPHDIDVLIQSAHAARAREILATSGFVLSSSGHGKIEALRFEGGELFFIDVAYSFAYLTEFFPYARVSDDFFRLVREDKGIEKFVHYLYGLRESRKYTEYIYDSFSRYSNILYAAPYVGAPVFRESLTPEIAVRLMKGSVKALLYGLTARALITLLITYASGKVQRLGSGKIVAILGPDGSGKSSVISALAKHLDMRIMYMGDWGFAFQPFYDLLQRGPLWLARLSYPFFYVENWVRILRAYSLKLRGYTVLLDRYPGFNRHMAKSESLVRLNNLMYSFFPNPDTYILLSAPASIIHARKQELTESEIERSQENVRRVLAKKRTRFIEVENVDLNACLNQVLAELFRK